MANTNLMFISALHYIPLAEGTAIIYLSPLLVTAMSGPLLGEHITPIQWFAVGFGFVGVIFIVRPGGSMFHPVALLALGAAFSFSLYQIITCKLNHTDKSSITNFISGLICVLVTTVLLPFFWKTPTPYFTLLMLLLGISAVVSHLLMTKAYQHAKPSTLAPFSYTQLLFAGLIGYLFFDQIPDVIGLVGMLVIVAGGLLIFSKLSYK
jgi:drug/metabolite transporter (DMT)-like permease